VENEMESSTQNAKLSNGEQKMVVAITMCLHNFFRENNVEGKDFSKCDRNADYVPSIPSRCTNHIPSQNASDTSTSQSSAVPDTVQTTLVAGSVQTSKVDRPSC
jgi:hypothetical protein